MSLFKEAVSKFLAISPKALVELEEILIKKSFEQDDYVLKQGAFCKHIYFVNKGMIRFFYLKDRLDITEWFAYDQQFCFSITSYFNDVPSKLIIQCIEDSEIFHLPKDELEKLASHNLEISKLYRLLLANSLIGSQLRMESIQFETALQRYQSLMKNNPEIIQRAPLKHIASFLGIRFETLSRIRKQLH